MPEITVHMAEGRTNEQKKNLMRDISDAVVKNLGVSINDVTVPILETPCTDKMKGGKTFVERIAEQKAAAEKS